MTSRAIRGVTMVMLDDDDGDDDDHGHDDHDGKD